MFDITEKGRTSVHPSPMKTKTQLSSCVSSATLSSGTP